MNQTKQQNNQGARPATATRNPPARLPGARAENRFFLLQAPFGQYGPVAAFEV